jgi:hypothetical protein
MFSSMFFVFGPQSSPVSKLVVFTMLGEERKGENGVPEPSAGEVLTASTMTTRASFDYGRDGRIGTAAT